MKGNNLIFNIRVFFLIPMYFISYSSVSKSFLNQEDLSELTKHVYNKNTTINNKRKR